MSGEKSDENIVVIKETSTPLQSYQCPILNTTNYTLWALRMKKILVANGVWSLVERKDTTAEIDVQKDNAASAYLFQGLPEDLQMQVAGCETANEIWESLKTRFVGTEDVQQAQSQQLRSEFKKLTMKEHESIDVFAGKLMGIITKAATCGLTFDQQTIVRKILNAVPERFVPIVATIELIVDLKNAKLEEIIGKLKTYEERIKFRKGGQEESSEKLLFTRQENDKGYERNYGNRGRGGFNQTRGRGRGRYERDGRQYEKGRNASYKNPREGERNDQDKGRRYPSDQDRVRRDTRDIECYRCHKFGHYARDCPEPDPSKEKANLAMEEEEPTLLMTVYGSGEPEGIESPLDKVPEYKKVFKEEEPSEKGIVIKKNEIPREVLNDMRSEIETDLKNKLEFWKFEILQNIEVENQEFEKKMRDREIAFKRQMQRDLQTLERLRNCISKEMTELKSEKEQFGNEKHEVTSDRKLQVNESSIDKGECKRHEETPPRLQRSQNEEFTEPSSEKGEPDADSNRSITRNKGLKIQSDEKIQVQEADDKDDKDDRDRIEGKEEPIQDKDKDGVQDAVRVKDKDKGGKTKQNGRKPKFKDK